MRRSYCKQIEIAYRDIDTAGHVSSSVYYKYMQNTYVLFMHDLLSLPFEQKISQIMVKTSCEYLQPAKFGNSIDVRAHVVRFGTKSFDIEYLLSLHGDEDALVARGASTHVMFDYDTSATRPVSDEFKYLVAAYQNEVEN